MQGDLFYSAGIQHGNLYQSVVMCKVTYFILQANMHGKQWEPKLTQLKSRDGWGNAWETELAKTNTVKKQGWMRECMGNRVSQN